MALQHTWVGECLCDTLPPVWDDALASCVRRISAISALFHLFRDQTNHTLGVAFLQCPVSPVRQSRSQMYVAACKSPPDACYMEMSQYDERRALCDRSSIRSYTVMDKTKEKSEAHTSFSAIAVRASTCITLSPLRLKY